MARSRLRQLEQLRSTEVYDDTLNQALAEDAGRVLESDLNHIRTQLKLLNQTPNWYDPPTGQPIDMFNAQIESGPILAGTALDAGGEYDAGSPYDLSVFLNGVILLPSTISGYVVTTSHDYQEVRANGTLAQSGDLGRKIKLNFDLVSGDIIQFIWNKHQ
jgi:hypothetical protein